MITALPLTCDLCGDEIIPCHSHVCDIPDFYSARTQAKRDRAEYLFNKFGPPEPTKNPYKRKFNVFFRYINAIPEL